MSNVESSCDGATDDAKVPKKQLLLTSHLKLFLANLLTPLIHNEVDNDEKLILNALQKKHSRGRSDGIEQIIRYMAESDDPTVKNKTTSINTLTRWMDECMQMGREENDRMKSDSGYGRNSSQNDIPAEVRAWAYLMEQYDEFKVQQEKSAVKITRYNRVPDHLQGTGVASMTMS